MVILIILYLFPLSQYHYKAFILKNASGEVFSKEDQYCLFVEFAHHKYLSEIIIQQNQILSCN